LGKGDINGEVTWEFFSPFVGRFKFSYFYVYAGHSCCTNENNMSGKVSHRLR